MQSIDVVNEGAAAIESQRASSTVAITPDTPVSNVPPSICVRPVKNGRGMVDDDDEDDDDNVVVGCVVVEEGVMLLDGSISAEEILTISGISSDNMNFP